MAKTNGQGQIGFAVEARRESALPPTTPRIIERENENREILITRMRICTVIALVIASCLSWAGMPRHIIDMMEVIAFVALWWALY